MAGIVVLFGVVGGAQGMALAFLVGVGMNFFAYWFSDRMVLKMRRARAVDEISAPQFYPMLGELAHVRHRDILISMLAYFAMFFGGRDEKGRPAAGARTPKRRRG